MLTRHSSSLLCPGVDFLQRSRTPPSLQRQQCHRLRPTAGRPRAPIPESVDEPTLYGYAHALGKARSYGSELPALSPQDSPREREQQTSQPKHVQLSPPSERHGEGSSQSAPSSPQSEQKAVSPGLKQALLRLLPQWSPRVRGLLLLNLLVLLVATNWVCSCCHADMLSSSPDTDLLHASKEVACPGGPA